MFCAKCGTQATEGTVFCAKCGSRIAAQDSKTEGAVGQPPLPTAAQAQIQAPPTATATQQPAAPAPMPQVPSAPGGAVGQPYQTQPYQMQTGTGAAAQMYQAQAGYGSASVASEPLPPSPLRAIILAAAALLLVAVSGFYIMAESSLDSTLAYNLYLIAVACGFYLIMQKELHYKLAAGAVLLVSSFIDAFRNAQATVAWLSQSWLSQSYNLDQVDLFVGQFGHSLPEPLLTALLIAALGILLGFILKTQGSNRRLILAGIGSGAVFAVVLVMSVFDTLTAPAGSLAPTYIAASAVSGIIGSLAFFGAYLVVDLLCNIKSYKLQAGSGAKVWFWVVTVLSSFALVGVIALANEGEIDAVGYLQILLTMLAIVGYALLIASKRLGYIVILLVLGVLFFAQLGTTLISLIIYGDLENLATLGSVFYSLLNPTITTFIVYSAWKREPLEPPFVRKPVPMVFTVFALIGLGFGLINTIFCTNILFDGKYYEYVTFLMFAVPGASLGLLAAIECFRKKSRLRKGLQITNIIFAALSVLFFFVAISDLFS